MTQPIRRIVTGHDSRGRSIIQSEGDSPHVRTSPGGTSVTELWLTDSTPADNRGDEDRAAGRATLAPPFGGTRFRVVKYPPDRLRFADAAIETASDSVAGRAAAATDTARHPGMHRTATVDYAIVLSGEIYAVMDEGETLMRAGDCLVQRGTSHAWSNRGEAPCLVAFVLVDAVPLD